MAEWFCRIQGKVLGPYSRDELQAMAEEKKLFPRHRVREGEAGEWFNAGDLKGLFTAKEVEEYQEETAPPWARKKSPVLPGGGQGYYATLRQSYRQGGSWVAMVLKVVLLYCLCCISLAFLMTRIAQNPVTLIGIGLLVSTVGLVVVMTLEALAVGVPCLILPKVWDNEDILEVFAATYYYSSLFLIGTTAALLTNHFAGDSAAGQLEFVLLLYPLVQACIFAYLACTRWNLPLAHAIILTGARFVTQSALQAGLFFVGDLALATLR